MSFDKDLKQAFERHAGDVSPTPGAWTGVERRIRRSHRIRTALATAGGAAAIVAVILVAPRLFDDRSSSDNPIGPGPRPSPTGTPTPLTGEPEGPSAYRNDPTGYFLVLPDRTWRIGMFEGAIDFRPAGLPGLQEDSETFGVEVIEAVDESYDATTSVYGDKPGTAVEIGGLPAKRSERSVGSGRYIVYRIRWTDARCPGAASGGPAASCPPRGRESTLRVAITAGNAQLWQAYGAEGEEIVRSIRATNSFAMPSLDVRTLLGAVKAGTTYDALTASLVSFLDARIIEDTSVIDEMLGTEARRQYDSHEGGLELYDPKVPPGYGGYDYTGYVIERRDDADANSAEYRVALIVGDRDSTSGRFFETIGVGPGGSKPAIVRFARYEGCDRMYANCQALSGG